MCFVEARLGAYLKRFVSVSGDVQYHYVDLATKEGFDGDEQVFWFVVGVEGSWRWAGDEGSNVRNMPIHRFIPRKRGTSAWCP